MKQRAGECNAGDLGKTVSHQVSDDRKIWADLDLSQPGPTRGFSSLAGIGRSNLSPYSSRSIRLEDLGRASSWRTSSILHIFLGFIADLSAIVRNPRLTTTKYAKPQRKFLRKTNVESHTPSK